MKRVEVPPPRIELPLFPNPPPRIELPLFLTPPPQISLTEIAERQFDLLDRRHRNQQEHIMLDRHDDRTITALVDDILITLRTNLEEHREIVEEARAGYLKKARAALDKKLLQLREGQIVALSFSLQPPQNHSKEFRTVIKMLELHKAAFDAEPSNKEAGRKATIELKADDVQRFVLNDWSWMDNFLTLSSAYSEKAGVALADLS